MAPEDNTSAAGHMGEQIPMETGDGGHVQFGPQSNTVPETYAAPEPGKQPPSKGGGAPIPPVTSIQPEAPDTVSGATVYTGTFSFASLTSKPVSRLPQASFSLLLTD